MTHRKLLLVVVDAVSFVYHHIDKTLTDFKQRFGAGSHQYYNRLSCAAHHSAANVSVPTRWWHRFCQPRAVQGSFSVIISEMCRRMWSRMWCGAVVHCGCQVFICAFVCLYLCACCVWCCLYSSVCACVLSLKSFIASYAHLFRLRFCKTCHVCFYLYHCLLRFYLCI